MKIFCVGKNYLPADRATVDTATLPQQPIIFLKPDTAYLHNHKPFFIPEFMGRIDFEVEVVVRINKLGKSIDEKFAHRYYDAITLGIDFTAHDVLAQLRAERLPWDLAKGFDGAATIGEWIDIDQISDIRNTAFRLDINGNTIQQGNTKDMIFAVDHVIAFVSQYYTLHTGDLLFTGTPAGAGPIHRNDHLEGYLALTTATHKVLDFNCK